MKLRTITLALAAAAIMVLGLAGAGLAFHDGGVASCNGCHTMHNSSGNAAQTSLAQFTGVQYLLKGADQSSACLSCHGSGAARSGYHVYTSLADMTLGVPAQHTPGGDFTWLRVGTAGVGDNVKATRGHNIIAADFFLAADTRTGMATSPGGSYPNASFNCISCHDPHGRYRIDGTGAVILPTPGTTFALIAESGSYGAPVPAGEAVGVYRILGGAGYEPKSVAGQGLAFGAVNPPVAVVASSYNITIGDNVVAYGQGMSEWCANCHASIHNDTYGVGAFIHPAGDGAKLTAAIVTNYNSYKKSGDLTGTGGAAAYWPLVPFEHGTADRAALAGYVTTPQEASTSKNVMCLSCHRAHGSGFAAMLRWNNSLMTDGGVYTGPGANYSAAQILGAYYDKPASDFAAAQRSLCNKCHAKD